MRRNNLYTTVYSCIFVKTVKDAQTLSVRLPKTLAKKVEEYVKEHDFVNISDFLRDLIRDKLEK